MTIIVISLSFSSNLGDVDGKYLVIIRCRLCITCVELLERWMALIQEMFVRGFCDWCVFRLLFSTRHYVVGCCCNHHCRTFQLQKLGMTMVRSKSNHLIYILIKISSLFYKTHNTSDGKSFKHSRVASVSLVGGKKTWGIFQFFAPSNHLLPKLFFLFSLRANFVHNYHREKAEDIQIIHFASPPAPH